MVAVYDPYRFFSYGWLNYWWTACPLFKDFQLYLHGKNQQQELKKSLLHLNCYRTHVYGYQLYVLKKFKVCSKWTRPYDQIIIYTNLCCIIFIYNFFFFSSPYWFILMFCLLILLQQLIAQLKGLSDSISPYKLVFSNLTEKKHKALSALLLLDPRI